jgi:hypothetical protein
MSLHAEPTFIEKRIRKQLDGRSFDRIQMQIPFGESTIIFLVSNTRKHSSFWTNCLIEFVDHDIAAFKGKHLFPLHKQARAGGLAGKRNLPDDESCRMPTGEVKQLHVLRTQYLAGRLSAEMKLVIRGETQKTNKWFGPGFPWKDGLVALPKILNFGKHTGRAAVPTSVCHRIINGSTDAGRLNDLVDSFRLTGVAQKYISSPFVSTFMYLEWLCPEVPDGGIVVWHGFHTTKGVKDSILPMATMFLDYTEKDQLSESERNYYLQLIRKQPFDPGSGHANARGSKTTIEFNAAKNKSQSMILPDTRLLGGQTEDPTMGLLEVVRDDIIHQGYGVIVPCLAGSSMLPNCFRWTMSPKELDRYHRRRRECKFEFEHFLTYWILEREMRYLTCWLATYSNYVGFECFWRFLSREQELFNIDDRRFRWPDEIKNMLSLNGPALNVDELQAKRLLKNPKDHQPLSNMSDSELVQFHYNSWVYLFKNARMLDITGTGPEQAVNWYGMFGGIFEGVQRLSTAASRTVFNDPYFMYWRKGMGSQKPNKKVPAMCVGTSLVHLTAFIQTKVNDGPRKHLHRKMAQGGGRKIAGDSGMGSATTYMQGVHHLQLQTGPIGATLAHAFYVDPMVVLERFRVKTHASWGAGHVDHSVHSRLANITYGTCSRSPPASPVNSPTNNKSVFKQYVTFKF